MSHGLQSEAVKTAIGSAPLEPRVAMGEYDSHQLTLALFVFELWRIKTDSSPQLDQVQQIEGFQSLNRS